MTVTIGRRELLVALAADVDNGKRLAEMRCATCHIVSPTQRRDVTDAPPFEAIARNSLLPTWTRLRFRSLIHTLA
jgi:hypothetical protein